MKKYIILICIVIFIVLSVIFYNFYLNNKIIDISNKIDYLYTKREILYEKELNLLNIEENKEILRNLSNDTMIKIATSREFPLQILEIENMLYKNDLTKIEQRVVSQQLLTINNTNIIMPRVNLVGRGTYTNIMLFLYNIKNANYKYNLETISIYESSIQNILEFEIILTMYYFEMENNDTHIILNDNYQYTNPFESSWIYE